MFLNNSIYPDLYQDGDCSSPPLRSSFSAVYSPLPKITIDPSSKSDRDLRRSTGGPYTIQNPELSHKDFDDSAFPSTIIFPPSYHQDSLVAAALAPYDSIDPDFDEYCRLSSKNNNSPSSSNRIVQPNVPPLSQPFAPSNSPVGYTSSSSPSSSSSSSPPPSVSSRFFDALPLPKPILSPISSAFSSLHPTSAAPVDPSQEGRLATLAFQDTAHQTKQLISEYCQSAENPEDPRSITRENRARLIFLTDTIELILLYLSQQLADVLAIQAYVAILNATKEQMLQTKEMISRIVKKSATMTPNFDIFELTLRRYQCQLTQMFPPPPQRTQIVSNPSLIITDPAAKQIWEQSFGHYCYFVSFETFERDIVQKQIFTENKVSDPVLFVKYLRYFLNFPSDNMVTTYKWNSLTTLFGPFREFARNFSTYALAHGFLGLTNRINAYEILTLKHTRRVLLLRLSRTEPEFLAFSYKNSKGEIGHQVNKDKNGQPISISVFLKQRFPGYDLVDERLDIDAILGKKNSSTLCDYADGSYGYIH